MIITARESTPSTALFLCIWP